MNDVLPVRPATVECVDSPPVPWTDAELVDWLAGLIDAHAERTLGPDAPDGRLLSLSLSRPRHHNGDRHHRVLTVRFSARGAVHERRIWLKFVNGGRSRYEAQVAIWNRTRGAGGLFPCPYFYGERGALSVIGMEALEATSLRSLFLRRSLARRAAALDPVFAALGRSLRVFHDSAEPVRAWKIVALERSALRAAERSSRLAANERREIGWRISTAADRAGGPAVRLPVIPLHHDCVLRNILVRSDASPALVDLDRLRAPGKSRWYDVAGLLINLESQIKFAPFVDVGSIARAWYRFWRAYAGSEIPDGLTPTQAAAVLYLMKIQYLFGIGRRPIHQVYTGTLAPRYLTALEASLLRGDHLALADRGSWRREERAADARAASGAAGPGG